MKTTGVMFKTPEVQLILAGVKTQVRKPADIPPHAKGVQYWTPPGGRNRKGYGRCAAYWEPAGSRFNASTPPPHGLPGDRIWIRETFCCVQSDPRNPDTPSENDGVLYRADDGDHERLITHRHRWESSMHMPREYARIWLEITGIRVERLMDISADDLRREGANRHVTPPPQA